MVSPGDDSARVARAVARDLEADALEPGPSDLAERAPRVDIVEAGRRLTAGRARDVGRELAGDAETLLFVDADCRLPAGAVALLAEALDDDGRAAVGASVSSSGRPRIVAWLRHLLEFKDAEPGAGNGTPWLVPSAALLVRADALDRAGGFPDLYPGEDWVLCARLRELGLTVRRLDTVVVDHVHPPGWGRMFAHQYRLGLTSALARTMAALPGAAFARRPVLVPLLFAGRLGRGTLWMLTNRPRELPLFILLFPLYVAALATWTAGFAAGASRRR